MKNWETAPVCAECVEVPTKDGVSVPTWATVVVIIIVLLTVGLAVDGMSEQVVDTTLATGGLLGIELVRRLINSLTNRPL